MSKHTKEPWSCRKDIIVGNDGGRESIACVLDVAWPHGLRPDPKANAHRIISCVNALEGLSNDALDGGWNFKSMSDYCKDIESQRNELLEALENIMGWIPAEPVKCNGKKCRELYCVSCFGEDTAEETLEGLKVKVDIAKQVIAKAKGGSMSVDIKQTAIEHLKEAHGFIVICDDGEQTYFGGDGIDLNKAIGLIERYKYQLLLDNYKVKGEAND